MTGVTQGDHRALCPVGHGPTGCRNVRTRNVPIEILIAGGKWSRGPPSRETNSLQGNGPHGQDDPCRHSDAGRLQSNVGLGEGGAFSGFALRPCPLDREVHEK